jgi:secreted PhoX family phosphatase
MNKILLASSALMLTAAGAIAQNCDVPINHVSNFPSVKPSAQPDSLRIPSTHTFQMLVQEGDPYSNPLNGNVKSLFDFTGYVAINGSSENGYLNINHEGSTTATGGVSVLDMQFNTTSKIWEVTQKTPVDFGPAQGTGRNCSGGITNWGTSITSEETLPSGDANGDGYQDIGWQVEIDPVTRSVVDYDNDGTPDKLWQMGRMSHENMVLASDNKTVYEANDENPGYVWKFVADSAGDLSKGKLYVLRLDDQIGLASSGSWRLVPNGTPTECNNVRSAATSLGATNFNSLEDVEISPVDGMIYFVSKASSRVYRFRDMGTTVNDLEVFAGNPSQNYEINYESNGDTLTAYEQWRDGNDNLTFDDLGNLYVIQDGGRNHIWMITPCHTMQNPDVRLFAVTPAGCEPTGMTFSPDYRFMFVSMQHPDAGNVTVMKDAAGEYVVFNRESAIVIAHNGFLGDTDSTIVTPEPNSVYNTTGKAQLAIAELFPNPATSDLNLVISSPSAMNATVKVYNMTGAVVMNTNAALNSGKNDIKLNAADLAAGVYNVTVTTNAGNLNARFIKQ